MKLLRYRCEGVDGPRLGILDGETIRELEAPSLMEWIDGDGREPTGRELPLAEATVLAPCDRAPNFRDFSAFEGHTRNGLAAVARLFPDRPAPEFPAGWFDTPGFYFSNPAVFRGPGESVPRPNGCKWLDFELEIGGVVGADGDIAGFMLLNDWSARDIQLEESALRMGHHKSKDFCTSIGPWVVTPDELPYEGGRLDLQAQVRLNGELVCDCIASDQHFSWPELLEYARRDSVIQPGEIIGSGTLVNGCLMEMSGHPDSRWLEPGDVVELHCDELGTLVSTVD